MNQPLTLAFDTSGGWIAAALLRADQIETVIHADMARGQGEHLMPLLKGMLQEARVTWRDLDLIGVGTGPGNFTGIRISVAAARGLAMSLDIPAIGVNGFEAARGVDEMRCWVAIDAPRDQVYLQRLGENYREPKLVPAALCGDLDAPLIYARNIPQKQQVTNIARIAYARKDQNQARPAPLYVRAPDAAPPKDPAPVLLP